MRSFANRQSESRWVLARMNVPDETLMADLISGIGKVPATCSPQA
jgi:hypothetical protein